MKYLLLTVLAALAIGCGNNAAPIAQNTSAAPAAKTPEKLQTAIAHGPEMKQPKTENGNSKSKWSQAGDPVDTKELDAAIMAAEKKMRAQPADTGVKKELANAFFNRAMLLTEARQYASALGDYRRTLKHDPTNAEAGEWIERIVSIYKSINRESPKEGEEPPPLAADGVKK